MHPINGVRGFRGGGLRIRFDRRIAGGFATLLAVIAGHVMLETARDALFLAALPPSFLPWAYLAIAALALAAGRLARASLGVAPRRRVLSASLALAAAGTAAFFPVLEQPGTAALLALYVWTGVLATVLTVQLWLLLGEAFRRSEAGHGFSIVAAGGLLGAVLGAALAEAIVATASARGLLLASAATFAGASVVPGAIPRAPRTPAFPRRGRRSAATWGELRSNRQLRLLVGLALVTSLIATGTDFVFKSAVADALPPARLGAFFARFYLWINVLALGIQLALAPLLLRRLRTTCALALLPVLSLGGAAGFVATGGAAAAVALKGADGILRHSLHRTSIELLFAPLAADVRDLYRDLAAGVGQRGGQAIASIVLLAVLSWRGTALHIAAALVVLCGTSLALLSHLHRERARKTGRGKILQTASRNGPTPSGGPE